jgi:anti-sigma B factor antagonist
MEWRAEVTAAGDLVTVVLHGDLDLLVQAELRKTLSDATEASQHVLLDLADVRLIDSTGLGLLVRAHQTVKRAGGTLSLVAPSRFVQTVLYTMRLHPVFPIFPDMTAAEEWVARIGSGDAVPRPVPVD